MSDEGRLRLITATKVDGTPWSLSKSLRFPSSESKHKAEPFQFPSTFASRSRAMGYGGRWEPTCLRGKDSPPPNAYNLPSTFNSTLGPILTQKPKRNDDNGVPGPGTYDVSRKPGSNSPRFSLQAKYK